MLHRKRKEGLVVKEMRDETLVYDENRHRAHCLNRTAALVWRHCDGKTSVAAMARLLKKELKIQAAEKVVWFALDRLRRAHLLQNPSRPLKDGAPSSRRELVRKLGLIGGLTVLLPTVTSIVAPTAAQAQTCVAFCTAAGLPCPPPACNRVCCPDLVCRPPAAC